MKQQTLAMAADQSFENYRKPTRRDEFLKTMEAIVPWAVLCAVIEPHYPKAGNGRPPIGLERMLRIHFVQHWFNLADMACEEALYDSASLRRFVGIDLGREPVPDSTIGMPMVVSHWVELPLQRHTRRWLQALLPALKLRLQQNGRLPVAVKRAPLD
jgi:hypothetical protein